MHVIYCVSTSSHSTYYTIIYCYLHTIIVSIWFWWTIHIKTYLFGVIQAKLILQTILARAQVQSKHGMRYEAEWLLECLFLRIKSVAAYEHIRRLKLLPLPSCSTLRRLLSGVSCHFGFNTAAVEKIVEGKSGKDISVILTFDEIALTTQPNFN